MLIFGTQDMKKKLFERENRKQNKKNGGAAYNNAQAPGGRSVGNRNGASN